METWVALGRVADLVTLLAAALAFSGLASTWLTRPRVSFTAQWDSKDLATLRVQHFKGASPARNLYLGYAKFDESGALRSGELSSPWLATLVPGEAHTITLFDPKGATFGSPPSATERRIPVPQLGGIVVDVSWQRPMLPWLRTRRVYVWRAKSALLGAPIGSMVTGRAATKLLKAARSGSKIDLPTGAGS
ncbi:hypothetical protein [Agromyces allii]|uniref:DUF1254 domain-containing protein n=1 Tax=Agromyces allii TaxID=393607 RepID=A0ABN2QMZ1_9MICO|nr:hypothetical protein [Agromyces allii]